MSTMHWLEVWRMWKFLGSSAWQRWESVPFLLKRASFDTRLFWAISGPNMFFTTLFCANGGSQSASVHRMVPYTITWSTMINIYRDFGLKGFPMEFESRDRNSWTLFGGFNHLEKYESQWEGSYHILWKIKFMFQTTNQTIHISTWVMTAEFFHCQVAPQRCFPRCHFPISPAASGAPPWRSQVLAPRFLAHLVRK